MKTTTAIAAALLLALSLAQAWDFTREYDGIPVYFDSVACQVPWTTGYSYINPTFADIDGDNDFDLIMGSDWSRVSYYKNNGDSVVVDLQLISDSLVFCPTIV